MHNSVWQAYGPYQTLFDATPVELGLWVGGTKKMFGNKGKYITTRGKSLRTTSYNIFQGRWCVLLLSLSKSMQRVRGYEKTKTKQLVY
jgi:hypothetical protein